MSSPTQPIAGPLGPVQPLPAAPEEDTAFLPELRLAERRPLIDAGRPGPPPEVLDQLAEAAAVHERLLHAGLTVSFDSDGAGGPQARLRDRDGAVLRSLSPAEVIALACGEEAL
jgi:hypothetical protein